MSLRKLVSTNEPTEIMQRPWQADCIMRHTYLLPLPAEKVYSLLSTGVLMLFALANEV